MQQSDPGFWKALWEVLVPSNTGEFWTMIAGLGTVAVAVLAWQGLRSLGLAKSDIVNRATRDARACAVERCEEFANDIIPGNRPVLQAIAKSKVNAFAKDASDVQFDPDDAGQVKAAKEFMGQVPNNVRREAIMFLNRLEAWATYFTNGLAEHEIAFGPCAPVYCTFVVQHYPILLVIRSTTTAGKYPNLVKLFKSWVELLDQQKRGLKQEDLLRQLRELQAVPSKGDLLPSPIGTKLDE